MTDKAFLDSVVQARIRSDVQAMHAYVVQDAAGFVKLDAMENPFGLPSELQDALGRRLGAVALNRYPDGRVNDLRQALARSVDLPQGYELLLGNGSDELISLLATACNTAAQPGSDGVKATVLAPVPGFVMYAMSAQLVGLDFVGVALDTQFGLDVPAMCAAIAAHRPALVYLAYPNNPTANLWDRAAMQAVIDAAADTHSLVVIDEAYQPFSSHTWLDVLRANPAANAHVLLMRTLSKFGLAGVRLGYLIGPGALIAQIDKVRPPYNVSVLNYECALFALAHEDVFAQQAATIRAQRERLQHALASMPGLTAYASEANMIVVRLDGAAGRAAAVFDGLKARGVLVKIVSAMPTLLSNCLRVTVGSATENDQLLSALKEVL